MTIRIPALVALAALGAAAACAPSMPDSNPSAGVGFREYDAYAAERARREAELRAMRARAVPEAQVIATETMTVLDTTRPPGEAGEKPAQVAAAPAPAPAPSAQPQPAPSPAPAPVAVAAAAEAPDGPEILSNPEISDEQEFDAVAARETIESDAERLERNRQRYQVVQPAELPERPGSNRPNIVAYALATTHPVGTPMFKRTRRVNIERFNRVCAGYVSDDLAQEAFLSNGGPERDRKGMDPDGDGYACYWDPAPFRTARGG